MNVPKILGVIIKSYSKWGDLPTDPSFPYKLEYTATLDPQKYDKDKYTKLFCKISNPGTSSYLFLCATVHRGEKIDEGTTIALLEDTTLKLSPEDQETFCGHNFKTVNHRSPFSGEEHIFFCDFQVDYSNQDIWFQKGIMTIILRLGTGDQNNKVDAWLPSQQFQLTITE
ncbi:MAG: hypothetical protein WC626_01900 [Methanoregula sp.]